MRAIRTGGLGFLLALAACTGTSGPTSLITPGGVPVAKGGSQTCPVSNTTTDINIQFQYATCQSVGASTDAGKARTMLTTGFALAQLRCDDFFWAKSRNQGIAKTARSTITPLVTLITGVLALQDFSTNPDKGKDYLQYLALGSAAATATINIYEEHFLFGAENVDAVRKLTMDALSEHRTAVLRSDPREFQSVLMHLVDHQAICRPVRILSLTRDAIKAGHVEPSRNSITQSTADVQDAAALVALGAAFNRVPVSPDEAGYLWWLYGSDINSQASAQDELRVIHERFKDWPTNPVILTGTTYSVALQPDPNMLRSRLSGLASVTLVRFSEQVATVRSQVPQLRASKAVDSINAIVFQQPSPDSYQSISVGIAGQK
jgi:hypothetical protein